MRDRERLIAIVIIACLALAGIYFIYAQVAGMYAFRNNAVRNIQKKVDAKDKQVTNGQRAQVAIDRVKDRALTGDLKQASTLYQRWYLDQSKQLGLEEVEVSVRKTSSLEGLGQVLHARFSARGNLDQLTRFLHAFYQLNIPHKVYLMQFTPVEGSRMLKWDFQSHALSLKDGKVVNTLPTVPSSRFAIKELDYYRSMILGRNIFDRPNQPPQLGLREKYEMRTDRPLSLDLKARDPDALDRVTFALEEGSAEGARISGSSLSFRADKPGNYKISIRATDDGLPPASSVAEITVTAVDPPPPPDPGPPAKPSFADAPFVLLSAVTIIDGRPQAWIRCLKDESTQHLSEGDEFTVGDLDGVIHRIDVQRNEVDMTVAQRHLVVSLGQSFKDARMLEEGWDDP